MHLVFFDECKNDPQYPHYHIGGVCIHESQLASVESLVNEIAAKAFGRGDLCRETELHAVDIFHRKANFKNCPDFGLRLEVLRGFAAVLNSEPVQLIDIQVNAQELYGTQDPAELAFMFLCERANDLIRDQASLGMLIGDRESDQVAARYAISLSGYKASGTDFAFGRDISCLVDSVHFTHSHLSRFLQLADVYTWLLQFQLQHRDSNHPRHVAVRDTVLGDGVDLFPSKYKEWPRAR